MKPIANFTYVIIIFNPNSTGDAPEKAKKLLKTLINSFPELSVELKETEYAGHAKEIAYLTASKHVRPLIVSVSGDGGYHEVVNGTVNALLDRKAKEPVVSVVGAGNANDHYRATNRLPLEELIATQQPRTIDLLKVTVKNAKKETIVYAHSYAGIGVSPRVAEELNRYKLNIIKEFYILVKSLTSLRPVTIEQQGKRRQVDSLVFANIREMAKVLTLTDKNNLHDGKFETIEITHGNIFRMLAIFAKAAVSSLGKQKQYTSYEFTLREDAPLQVDGEVIKAFAGDSIIITSAKDAIKALY